MCRGEEGWLQLYVTISLCSGSLPASIIILRRVQVLVLFKVRLHRPTITLNQVSCNIYITIKGPVDTFIFFGIYTTGAALKKLHDKG